MFNKDFKLKPVEFNHPIMMLGDIPEESRQIWESYARTFYLQPVIKTKTEVFFLE